MYAKVCRDLPVTMNGILTRYALQNLLQTQHHQAAEGCAMKYPHSYSNLGQDIILLAV
ncbi:MAG: hypothetical protein ACP5VS_11585 [Desulfomonilaceae bacterium]